MPPSKNGTKPTRENFTMVPNIVMMMDLSPYEKCLYLHIKMVAGESHVCWQTTSALATACRMSTGEVSRAKAKLVREGLISVEPHPHGSRQPHQITVVEVWHKNHALYHQVPFPKVTRIMAPSLPQVNGGEALTSPGEVSLPQVNGQIPPSLPQVNGAEADADTPKIPYEDPIKKEPLIKFCKGFESLKTIPKYQPDKHRDASLVQFLEDNAITPDVFFRASVSLSAGWPPRTAKNPDPWLSVRKYCLNQKKWDADADRGRATMPPKNAQRPRRVEPNRDPEHFEGGFWGDGK